ncbi:MULTISPECIES: bifunctional glycosyltransferase family 2 protein/CDP-glycerol:glycerophosphate glycerophosphotransferase [unclassified Streptomyces]|uniref:bifunctional glycosyltransferase/CDP-glycerol:glycerophosphate glycerophosphotransferase n=1 Tax=unclassified Streptomyces TaxID=2593676 RepID=UPI00278BB1E5|nr:MULTISPECIES: bifunctional glycosyltransferase family 2 protein/CDP-glycerol:glycerophosphate glycerophosphotransferase [unclassified Streptomyces]
MSESAPRLSVVVPFQNVDTYLEECLRSIASQTFQDFEVVLVDDGSTDGSAGLAARHCAADPRFRLIRQDAHGPGHARNTGLRAVHPDAEFLAFVDGDDVIPEYAYELLIGTLAKSGSDFVSGNVRMMNSRTSWPSTLHHKRLSRDRRGTHITRHHDLIFDRTVWNKVFRRSFWDRTGITYPEGILYEDVWVNLVAHYSAERVDVVAAPVYYWRRRDRGAAPSITQTNQALGNVRDRITAVGSVSRYLAERAREDAAYVQHKRRYDRACLESDLMIHLNVLPDADDETRGYFMRHAADFVEGASEGIVEELGAVDRVKWSLVRAGRLDELLSVLEFERGNRGSLPVRRRLRRHLAYPHLGDRRTGVPKSAYRLGPEFTLRGSLVSAEWEDGRLKLAGRAYIRNLDVSKRRHSLKAVALRQKKQGRFLALPARTTYAPEATEHSGQQRYSYDWSGFEATIDPERLKRNGQWVEGTWDVAVGAFSRGLFRYKSIIAGDAGSASHPRDFYVDKNVRVVPLFVGGALKLRVEIVRARVTGHRVSGDHLELRGVLLAPETPETAVLRVRALTGAAEHAAPVDFTDGGEGWCTFRTRIPLRELTAQGTATALGAGSNGWKTTLHIPGRKRPLYPVVAPDTADGAHPLPERVAADRELVVLRNASGYLVLFVRDELPVADRCTWSDDGTLTVEGAFPGQANLTADERAGLRLVVRSRAKGEEREFPVACVAGRFRFALDPARVHGLSGAVPLAAGRWDFAFRVPGRERDLVLKARRDLIAALPSEHTVAGRRFEVQSQQHDRFTLRSHSGIPAAARGPYGQRQLRTRHYPACRKRPVRAAVLFDSFRGAQIADSPRAIYDELVRRGSELELLWVVRDDQVEVPEGARAVRMWSPEWYEALARSRYLVYNNHFPAWFRRREGQRVVQTWHGTPLKKIGHDIESVHFSDQGYLDRLGTEVGQWDMLVSPNSFSTPILRRAFGFEGEMLETGYPRNDVHHHAPAEQERRAAIVRRRLGLPADKKVVLYAPTWRDDQYHAAGKYTLDFRVDLDDARARLGDDHVLLVRRHPNVVDPVPGAGDGFVFDVSTYNDMADLMLVTDVLVTDYSSLMFDFANTGRPMLFFTYDLDHYRDTLRGFYFDFERSAPGPLLDTSRQLVDAVRDIDAISGTYALKYRHFKERYCDLEDGSAAARVVDRMLGVPERRALPSRTLPSRTRFRRAA